MNKIWNLVVLIFCINIAAGIFYTELGMSSNIKYNSQMASDANIFGVNTNTTTNPIETPPVEQSNLFDWVSSFLNLIGLGFILKLLNFFVTYLFGITLVLKALVPGMTSSLVIFLNIILGFMYTFGIISIIRGNDINNQS